VRHAFSFAESHALLRVARGCGIVCYEKNQMWCGGLCGFPPFAKGRRIKPISEIKLIENPVADGARCELWLDRWPGSRSYRSGHYMTIVLKEIREAGRQNRGIGKSWPKQVLEIGKSLKLQCYFALRCIGNNVISMHQS